MVSSEMDNNSVRKKENGGRGGGGGVDGGGGAPKSSDMMRKVLLGIGFWVQGMRCFPWMGVNFYLKDGLKVNPSTLQILQNSTNLPMVAKPFYGILSDSFYISGQHRLPYIAIGALLQALSWLAIGYLSSSSISFFAITTYLLIGNLGASIVEVANDAIVAETAKEPSSPSKNNSKSGGLQSFVWMAASIGGSLGNLLAGIAIEKYSPRAMFYVYGIILSLQFLITVFIHESSLDLPKSPSNMGIKKQVSELLAALRKPDICYSIAWFSASYAIIPSLVGTMFYYQTQHLHIESSVLGISKVIGQGVMLLWGVLYNGKLKSISPRRLLSAIQLAMAGLMISDLLFVKGFYRIIGVSDSMYVLIISGVAEVALFFRILPFTVLMAKLCPQGCEGSVMAFLMSAIALAFIVSGYFGVALASYVKVTGNDFSGLPKALMIQAVCTLLPLFWSSWIPDEKKTKTKDKKN